MKWWIESMSEEFSRLNDATNITNAEDGHSLRKNTKYSVLGGEKKQVGEDEESHEVTSTKKEYLRGQTALLRALCKISELVDGHRTCSIPNCSYKTNPGLNTARIILRGPEKDSASRCAACVNCGTFQSLVGGSRVVLRKSVYGILWGSCANCLWARKSSTCPHAQDFKARQGESWDCELSNEAVRAGGGRLAAEQRGLGPSILSSPNDSDEPIATAIRPAYGGPVLAWPFDIYRSDEPESMVSANDDLEHFLGVAKQLLILYRPTSSKKSIFPNKN